MSGHGCCTDGKIHRKCFSGPVTPIGAAECQRICSLDAQCKAFYYGNITYKNYCYIVTENACPSDFHGPYDDANIGELEDTCDDQSDFSGCFIKKLKIGSVFDIGL